MHILVFGANGKVGSLVVKKLLADGHKVRAFIYQGDQSSDNPNLVYYKGNVKDIDDVRSAMIDIDVVISCLGSWGTKTKDILSSGMKNIIPAMEQKNIPRIISLTGHDARAKGDVLSLSHRLSHYALGLLAPKILHDGEQHITLLENSNLQWTVIRSPVMTNGPQDKYTIRQKRPFALATIPREAVVQAIVDQLGRKSESQRAIYIGRS